MDSIKFGMSTFFYKNSMSKSSISTFALQPVNSEGSRPSECFVPSSPRGNLHLIMSVI